MPWAWGPSVVGAHEESREEEVSEGGHAEWIDAHRHESRASGVYTGEKRKLGWVTVGDGCSKWRKSRGRKMGQMLAWSQQIVQCLQGKEKVSLVTIIGEKRVTR